LDAIGGILRNSPAFACPTAPNALARSAFVPARVPAPARDHAPILSGPASSSNAPGRLIPGLFRRRPSDQLLGPQVHSTSWQLLPQRTCLVGGCSAPRLAAARLRSRQGSAEPLLRAAAIPGVRTLACHESRAGLGIGEKTSGPPRQGPTTGSGLCIAPAPICGGSGTVLERCTADAGEAPAMRAIAFRHRRATRVRPGSRRCGARGPSAEGCE
jgi:hypothetical protein